MFTLSVFIWKSTCVYDEGEKEAVPYFVLYFIEVCERGASMLTPGPCLSRYSKLQIVSRIHKLVSVFDSLICK